MTKLFKVHTLNQDKFITGDDFNYHVDKEYLTIKNDGYVVAVFPRGAWTSVEDLGEFNDTSGFIDEIADFMEEGGQPVPEAPDWTAGTDALDGFINRCKEELNETIQAADELDTPEIVDGFLDLAYVAFTGALRVAGRECTMRAWEAINAANTSKIDGSLGPVVRDPDTGKILKPEDWEAPDIFGILTEGQ